jgi:membrane protease YdiL (CAAX protease family)
MIGRFTVIAALSARRWAFLAVCATAGVLAVPLHAVASPVSAIAAALVGLMGLLVWRWSRLPASKTTEPARAVERLAQLALAMGAGLVVGLLLLAVLRLAIQPAVPEVGARLAAAGAIPIWRRVSVVYVAAVGEELVFRLLLLSFIAGLGARLSRRVDTVPNGNMIWVAISVSAIAFAAAHIPAWVTAVPLSLGLVLAIFSLNALGGIAFGWVFVRRGIVAAMWAHAGADCAMQLIGPLTG